MSSTHMKMMIALRRVSTPMTPIVNSTADSARDSASIAVPPAAEHDGSRDRDQQQYARQLERKQVFIEQRTCNRANRPVFLHLGRGEAGRNTELGSDARSGHSRQLRYEHDADERGDEHRPFP